MENCMNKRTAITNRQVQWREKREKKRVDRHYSAICYYLPKAQRIDRHILALTTKTKRQENDRTKKKPPYSRYSAINLSLVSIRFWFLFWQRPEVFLRYLGVVKRQFLWFSFQNHRFRFHERVFTPILNGFYGRTAISLE